MTTYTLNVNIDPDQVALLKDSDYKLCISKKVNGKYCVVWEGKSDYSASNKFQWTETYQTFASNSFTDGLLVSVETNKVPIALGQTATIDKGSRVLPATGPVGIGSHFTVINNWKPCHLGVDQRINGKFSPIFVDPKKSVLGTIELTPIVSVMVFFSRSLETESMFFKTNSSSIPIEYAGVGTTQTVSYVDVNGSGNGIWVVGAGDAGPKKIASDETCGACIPRSYSVDTGFEALPAAYDAFFVGALVEKFKKLQPPPKVNFPPNEHCPVGAFMKFSNDFVADQALHMLDHYVTTGRWPGYNMSAVVVGSRKITEYDSSVIEVALDNAAQPGGPVDPVKAAWDGFWMKEYYPPPTKIEYRWQ